MNRSFSDVLAEMAPGKVVDVPTELLELSSEIRAIDNEFVGELSFNAKDLGILQNILVTADVENQKFSVRDGNHRVQVAIDLSLETVPAMLLSEEAPNTALLASKMSTLTHSTMELALLCSKALTEGATKKDLAERFEVHKSKVSELIKISELPEDIQQAAKAEPKKFNHMTLLKLAKLEGEAQKDEFNRIKSGLKSERARFSSLMSQLDSKKLTKKKLTASDVDVLVDTIDTIVQVLTNRQLHADVDTNVDDLRNRVWEIVTKEEAPEERPEPFSESEQEKDMTPQPLLSCGTEEATDSVNGSTEMAA